MVHRSERASSKPAPAAHQSEERLPPTTLRPLLDAVHSEDAGAAATSVSLAVLYEVMSLTGPTFLGAVHTEVIDTVASYRLRCIDAVSMEY